MLIGWVAAGKVSRLRVSRESVRTAQYLCWRRLRTGQIRPTPCLQVRRRCRYLGTSADRRPKLLGQAEGEGNMSSNIPMSEYTYIDPASMRPGRKEMFPSLFSSPAEVRLTVVVPAYNEEARLPAMMDEALAFLEKWGEEDNSFTYEIIVANDGSRDKTALVALEYTKRFSAQKVRVLSLAQNAGKGVAVKKGIMAARGAVILFCDADGATRFADLSILYRQLELIARDQQADSLENAHACVIGSRYHLKSSAERSLVREFVSRVFNLYVQYVGGVRGVRDTQCGFKLFTRRSAQLIFPCMHLDRWAFDVEALYIAQAHCVAISEVPVQWMEIPGSKLSVVKASLNMARDMALMRWNYLTGVWSAGVPDLAHVGTQSNKFP
ncbi:Dolichyl-phosphate beta-glucosyltransferase [Porphyridium purpureum]|uniref:dolichyl-phosphate beta-glucosyltransferase n=1 Tax=Porphyridium purpureum TaxID=35688 RepID=A0A5J4YLA8_PORPP|nr:Dolichyl-phosphate beta-glucosyltransferase [Porphyridium purpureum]|eukprot:POR6123..scf244_11